MAEKRRNTFEVPFSSPIADASGLISSAFQGFFRSIYERLNPLGIEMSARIVAHATDVYDVEGLAFTQRSENAAIVDYLIQRVSSDIEQVEIGTLYIYYKPRTQTWVMDRTVYTGSSTVTLSIDSVTGQVRYQAQLLSGPSRVEKITWRAKTFTAKFRGNY